MFGSAFSSLSALHCSRLLVPITTLSITLSNHPSNRRPSTHSAPAGLSPPISCFASDYMCVSPIRFVYS